MIRFYDEFRCQLLQDQIIKPLLPTGKIPFLMKFDIVVSNQVIEHVDNLKTLFENIRRVLKPDGIMHHHFPCSETIREGHIGIPFAHWFPPGQIRYIYTYLIRSLGFGYHKAGQSNIESWTRYKLDWIDAHCRYREFQEVKKVADWYGYHSVSMEMDYIKFRVKTRPILNWLTGISAFQPIYEFLFRRLGFRVIDLYALRASVPPAELDALSLIPFDLPR